MKIRKFFRNFVVTMVVVCTGGSINASAGYVDDMLSYICEKCQQLQERWPDGSQRMDLAINGYRSKSGICYFACMGFAVNMYEEIFKECLDTGDPRYTLDNPFIVNVEEILPSDIVVFNGNTIMDHAIFVTSLGPDGIYYADCNGALDCSCIVKWNNYMSTEELKEKLKHPLVDGSSRGKEGFIMRNQVITDSVVMQQVLDDGLKTERLSQTIEVGEQSLTCTVENPYGAWLGRFIMEIRITKPGTEEHEKLLSNLKDGYDHKNLEFIEIVFLDDQGKIVNGFIDLISVSIPIPDGWSEQDVKRALINSNGYFDEGTVIDKNGVECVRYWINCDFSIFKIDDENSDVPTMPDAGMGEIY